jgi:hypothetical protein
MEVSSWRLVLCGEEPAWPWAGVYASCAHGMMGIEPHGLLNLPQKFTKWADKGTHVNPFLPPRSSKGSRGLAVRLVGWVGGLVLFLLRLPFLFGAIAMLVVTSLATSPPFLLTAGAGERCGGAPME